MHSKFNLKNNGFELIKNSKNQSFKNLCKRAYHSHKLFPQKKLKKKWSSLDGTIKLVQNPHKKIEEFKKILKSKFVKKILNDYFGNVPLAINHSKISFKHHKSDQRWFPHQDIVYFKDKSQKGLTLCIYLEDNLKDNGNIICYKNSHKSIKKHKIVFLKNEKEPQIKCNTNSFESIFIKAEIGDILCINTKTIHSSGNNHLKKSTRPIFIFSVVQISKEKIELDDDGEECFVYNGYRYPRNIIFHKFFYKLNLVKINFIKKILYILYKINFFKNREIII